jgi:hypothetical protein
VPPLKPAHRDLATNRESSFVTPSASMRLLHRN